MRHKKYELPPLSQLGLMHLPKNPHQRGVAESAPRKLPDEIDPKYLNSYARSMRGLRKALAARGR